CQRGNKHPYSF
nr:immunoglobulin light chain junction region [Macaca mulatta]MOX86489.1 immunoglobulin light chain junction region [Macaca mulatta]MOX86651.1 immunoglobulin light chain junction region [Macaca mulatta]MOX87892.1 immunoglobulin light chain junction region [Macaca mulatta]MOX88237.1 immunoglobulin light chain junction region [Macaca mulatta]